MKWFGIETFDHGPQNLQKKMCVCGCATDVCERRADQLICFYKQPCSAGEMIANELYKSQT